jgi:hypothetical protein
LPAGIFTADGVWFHTSESALREFAGEVIEQIGMGKLLMTAGAWLRSADTVGALSLALFLLIMHPVVAVLLAFAIYITWDVLSPSFAFILLVRAVRALSGAAFQGVLFVIVLSWLGMNDQVLGAILGLVCFVLLRWGLARNAVSRLEERYAGGDMIPKADRVLRGLLIRHALALGITLPPTAVLEERILEIWSRGKRD